MRRILVCACVLLLDACGRSNVAEVVDRSPQHAATARPAPPRRAEAATVVVARGDTLYAIAFRLGTDFQRLAAVNGIRPPYTIYPGQRLRLDPGTRPPAPPPPPRATASPESRVGPLPLPPPPAPARPAQAVEPAPAVGEAKVTQLQPPTQSPRPAVPDETPVVVASITPDRMRQSAGISWRWPARGRLLNRFVAGDPARQGVDIAGKEGEPVLAVADGQVVYSGNGLLGYGELIIVKHSNAFLSAYGHNRRRLLGEGAQVKAGQQIAEMGRSGAGIDLLHFEIRRNGKPVDPLGFLPPR